MSKYQIDKELRILQPLKFKKYTRRRRQAANRVFNLTVFFTKPKKGLKRTKYFIKGYNHDDVRIFFYEKKGDDHITPIILYIHGGGFQMEGTPVQLKMMENLVMETGYKAVYVKYRLAPKHPFPTGFFDCYHTLLWIKEHATYLNIDPKRIIVAGESAGGNLATGIALYARDNEGPKIYKQMLIYPVIDIKQDTDSMKQYTDTPMWNSILNKAMWETYLSDGDHGMLHYASPSLADVSNLPETYIETAQYDCLRDEAIDYARRLVEANVLVTEYHTRGTVHGYDAVFFSKLTKQMLKNRIDFLKK